MTDETNFGGATAEQLAETERRAEQLADRLKVAEGALRQIIAAAKEPAIRRANGQVAAARMSQIAATALAAVEAMR